MGSAPNQQLGFKRSNMMQLESLERMVKGHAMEVTWRVTARQMQAYRHLFHTLDVGVQCTTVLSASLDLRLAYMHDPDLLALPTALLQVKNDPRLSHAASDTACV